jgi:NADPH-dependent curcumin reductase CurA
MTDIATLSNQQVRLAQRPVGAPTRANWQFTTEPVQAPAAGGVLVKTVALSLDPAMRGWMNEGKSYIPPVGIGEVMRAGGVGKVIASQNPKFAVGDLVTGGLGVQAYAAFGEEQARRGGLARIDTRLGSVTQWLNVLGMPGMTAYFGLLEVGRPRPGDTVASRRA